MDADWKIRQKYDAKEFDPFNPSDGFQAYQGRLWYAVFVFGRYWLLWGRKEVATLKWEQVKFLTTIENGLEVEFVEVVQHFDKGNPINLKNTTARSVKEITPCIYPNVNNPLCPIAFLKFYKSLCPLEQVRFSCKPSRIDQRKRYMKKNYLTSTTITSYSVNTK